MNITRISLAVVGAIAAIGVAFAASGYGGSVDIKVGPEGIDFEMTGEPFETEVDD